MIGEEEYISHVWSLLSFAVYLVDDLLPEKDETAWVVEIVTEELLETKQVTKGLPLTRKNLRLEEGKSSVTPRSLKEEIKCVFLECGSGPSDPVMVMSAVKAL